MYGSKGHVPDYMVRAGVTYSIITDHLGSVRFVVNDATGNVVQSISYDEFGNVLSNTNTDFQPFGYAGGLYDVKTSLVKFGFRDYDALVGRWTAKDPVGFIYGYENFYSYCEHNPINLLDPTGLFCIPYPSKKTEWQNEGYYYDRQYDCTPMFSNIEGAIGKCIWQQKAKIDQLRTTTKRKLCYEIDKCNNKIKTYFKEGETQLERRTVEVVFDTRVTPAIRMFSGGDIEKGDLGTCKNPWTGQAIIFTIGY